MIRSLISFAFILTHAVLAQAGENGAIHIDSQKWVIAYSAQAQFEGLPVIAQLDVGTAGLQIPQAMASDAPGEAMVPSDVPAVAKKSYRLRLIVSQSPLIQMTYPVEPRTVLVNGTPRNAFVSESNGSRDLHFVITTEEDGSLNVTYSCTEADGNLGTGSFALAPVPQPLSQSN